MTGSDSTITYDNKMLTKTADLIDAAIMSCSQGITITPAQLLPPDGDPGYNFNFPSPKSDQYGGADGTPIGFLIAPDTDGITDAPDKAKPTIDPNPMTQSFSSSYNHLLFSLYMVDIKMESQLAQTEDNVRKMASVYQQTEDTNKRAVFDVTLPLSSRG